MSKIQTILKDSAYKLDKFEDEEIANLESKIIVKNTHGGETFYFPCQIRNKEVKLSPEELIHQLYIYKLIHTYHYPKEKIEAEVSLQQGRDKEKKRIDILVRDKNGSPYIVVEVKKPSETNGYKQLESYVRWCNAPIGILCNGDSIEEFYYNKEDKKYKTSNLEILKKLPHYMETLHDILGINYTLKQLYLDDELQLRDKTLKKIIKEFEDVILAHAGVDSFEEIFKLIFTKLYDEYKSKDDFDAIAFESRNKSFNGYGEFRDFIQNIDDSSFRNLEFRTSEDDENFKKRLNNLFEEAKQEWKGIFDEDSIFELSTEELKISVLYLQNTKLFNSNFEVIDDAFEYIVTKGQKGEKGQYFTPRYVIDMCVRMLNPKFEEKIIDTASGSCGFPMHCILYVWNKLNPKRKNLLSAQKKTKEEKAYVNNNVFAIDFDKKSVRIGRLLNKIAGDGETNVLLLNSLHYKHWKKDVKVANWEDYYKKGFKQFEKVCVDKKKYIEEAEYDRDYSHFNFDIVMANPPFAGDITSENLYKSYELGKNKISRDILFIERNLNMLRAGGRMAIVLPQGRFNNSSDKYIREFIADKARILAVVGLHGNVFKPHTGTKTSVLFLQKWGGVDKDGKEICPKLEDYNIFFATMNEPSKDNSGEKIYVKQELIELKITKNKELIEQKELSLDEFSKAYKSIEEANFMKFQNKIISADEYKKLKNEEKQEVLIQSASLINRPLLDSHGHLIVRHDLYNHDGLTQDGIAEAFIDFAKSENLSFWRE